MTVIYNNKDTGMLVNLKEVYSGMRAAVAPSMSTYENSLKKKIASDLDFGNEVIVEHAQGGKASGRPGYHFTVYVVPFDNRKQALLNAYLDNLINSGGFVYGDADNGMIIRHPQPRHDSYQDRGSDDYVMGGRGRASVEHFKKMEKLRKETERKRAEKERKRAEKEKRRKSIIPTFRSDLDFVIRVPKAVLNSSDIKEAGSLLAAVEKSVRQVYRKLNPVVTNVSIPFPQQPPIKGFKKASTYPTLQIMPAGMLPRSNSKALLPPPSMWAQRHYVNDAIFESELQNLKSKAFMPNETTLVLPAGSFNQNMYYLLSDLFDATGAGATLGFEEFTDTPTETIQPIAITASEDENVASPPASNSENKGLSSMAIGGIVAAVVVVGVGAFYLGKRR
jgi:hypothetical protein